MRFEAGREQLDHEPAIVAVHHERREPVALAVHQPVGRRVDAGSSRPRRRRAARATRRASTGRSVRSSRRSRISERGGVQRLPEELARGDRARRRARRRRAARRARRCGRSRDGRAPSARRRVPVTRHRRSRPVGPQHRGSAQIAVLDFRAGARRVGVDQQPDAPGQGAGTGISVACSSATMFHPYSSAARAGKAASRSRVTVNRPLTMSSGSSSLASISVRSSSSVASRISGASLRLTVVAPRIP